jgi:chemotaxis protein methyltransferase CheR
MKKSLTFSDDIIMSEEEFRLFRELIDREFGITIKDDRRLTLQAKLSHRLKILGILSYRDYYNFLNTDPSAENELLALAGHITNNETYFFREKVQIDAFSELLKDIKREKQKKKEHTLQILSVACSSGEEPYSLSITLHEGGLFLWGWDVKITGVDIDKHAIERARNAIYTDHSFRAVNGSFDFIKKYFVIEGHKYRLKKTIAESVEFRQGNITKPQSFTGLHHQDVIFCRNVLIYMNDEAIEMVARNLYNCLSDSGYLFIGSTESLMQRTNLFTPVHKYSAIIYRKNG